MTGDKSPFLSIGIIWDWCQIFGALEVKRVWLHNWSKSLWKCSSFQIIAGILSGTNDFEAFNCLVAAFSSGMVKGEVFISKVSDTGTLGREALPGTLALLPRRFWKCVDQVSKRFLADPPLILTDDPKFLPEMSSRWCFLLMCSSERLLILLLIKSTSAFK